MSQVGAAALRDALDDLLSAREGALLLGESIGTLGGIHHCTRGLLDRWGPERVMDMPLSEEAMLGLATGIALGGGLPVVELLSGPQLQALGGTLAREWEQLTERTSGDLRPSMVLRIPDTRGLGVDDANDSQAPEDVLVDLKSVRVSTVSRGEDLAPMLRAGLGGGLRVCVEPVESYGQPASAPGSSADSQLWREGDDLLLISWGSALRSACEAADRAASRGWGRAAVMELRTLSPFPSTLVDALRVRGRVLVVRQGRGAYTHALLQHLSQGAFEYLQAPPAALDGSPSVEEIAQQIRVSKQF